MATSIIDSINDINGPDVMLTSGLVSYVLSATYNLDIKLPRLNEEFVKQCYLRQLDVKLKIGFRIKVTFINKDVQNPRSIIESLLAAKFASVPISMFDFDDKDNISKSAEPKRRLKRRFSRLKFKHRINF